MRMKKTFFVSKVMLIFSITTGGFPWWLRGKESSCNAGDTGDTDSIPGLGRSSGGRDGNPLQYSCLGNPMDRGAWRAIVHGVAKSQTQLSDLANMHAATTNQSLTKQSSWTSWVSVVLDRDRNLYFFFFLFAESGATLDPEMLKI